MPLQGLKNEFDRIFKEVITAAISRRKTTLLTCSMLCISSSSTTTDAQYSEKSKKWQFFAKSFSSKFSRNSILNKRVKKKPYSKFHFFGFQSNAVSSKQPKNLPVVIVTSQSPSSYFQSLTTALSLKFCFAYRPLKKQTVFLSF